MTPNELLDKVRVESCLIDRGYDLAELDRKAYCLWSLDCARHVLPLLKNIVEQERFQELGDAIGTAADFVMNGEMRQKSDTHKSNHTIQHCIPEKQRVVA